MTIIVDLDLVCRLSLLLPILCVLLLEEEDDELWRRPSEGLFFRKRYIVYVIREFRAKIAIDGIIRVTARSTYTMSFMKNLYRWSSPQYCIPALSYTLIVTKL